MKKNLNEWMRKKMHNDYNEWMIKYEIICIENGDKESEWVSERVREREMVSFLQLVYDQIYILLC